MARRCRSRLCRRTHKEIRPPWPCDPQADIDRPSRRQRTSINPFCPTSADGLATACGWFTLIVKSLARLRSPLHQRGDDIRYRRHAASVFLFAFDLIELNGDGREPFETRIETRKATLASALAKAAPGLRSTSLPPCCATIAVATAAARRWRYFVPPRAPSPLRLRRWRRRAIARRAGERRLDQSDSRRHESSA